MAVKRDMDLVREILLQIRQREDLSLLPLKVVGVDDDVVARHGELLIEAGLLDGKVRESSRNGVPFVVIRDLTWEGHDFLAVLENADVWSQLRQAFKPAVLAALPFSILKSVGGAMLSKWAMRQVGLGD